MKAYLFKGKCVENNKTISENFLKSTSWLQGSQWGLMDTMAPVQGRKLLGYGWRCGGWARGRARGGHSLDLESLGFAPAWLLLSTCVFLLGSSQSKKAWASRAL